MAEPPDRPASGLDDTAVAATQPSDGDPSSGGGTDPDASASGAPRQRLVHAGDTLGRYVLDEEVGEGGMATVFRARDKDLRREVAIKVLFPHLARRDEVVRRFQREARAAAGLEHPNILRIYDVGGGTGGDPPFIVMELIRGRSLLGEIEQRGTVLAEIVACIGALLADALGAAHAAGIVHRDVKPANVLIAQGGRLLLADFGVARLETEDSLVTKTGAVLGTPAYMSPEQATGDTSTRKSDLYSLGATLYQLATGSLPYSGSPAKVLSLIATGNFVPAVRRRASVGGDLSRVIDRLMAVDADARPESATAVAAELRAIAATGGLGDPTDELSAYFEDPEAFVRDRTPRIVSSLVLAAQRAVSDSKLPRAMALADRASAMAPDDPSVTALIQTVTDGGRASSRRRLVALVAAGAVLAGGATLGVRALRSGDDVALPARLDAASPGPAPDAGAVAIAPTPDAPPPPAVVDAAAVAMISAVDAATEPRRPDAGKLVVKPVDAGAIAVAPLDASPAVDAGELAVSPPPDAAPAEGAIEVTNDTWCVVSLDDKDSGRLNKPPGVLRLAHIAPGRHRVLCSQGQGGNHWEHPVDVVAGQTAPVGDHMLGELVVTIATPGDVTIDGNQAGRRGTITHLSHGQHHFEATGITGGYLTIAADCTLGVRVEDSGAKSFQCDVR